ncbi:MAG TPA: polysaccharide biosynthesis/export family protein [Candidatus Sulfotelmatobacter sp.]|nr:polysaccharide biosynthesis/export family protein [Candidatus Sulfotelmatobacter sp.]
MHTISSAPARCMVILLSLCTFVAAQQGKTPGPAMAAVSTDTAKPAPDAASNTAQFKDRSPRYRIQAGDSFDVSFELSPEFNQTVSVQPDGFVTLRSVGDLKVAGQTVPELTQTLRGAYSKILNDPLISVVLKEFEKPYFVADGQVAKPGKYEMHGGVTLTQAIAIAGGFNSSAKHSQVLLFRRIDDQWTEAKLIDVKKMQKSGNLNEDPFLHPGDMLFVPKNTMSKIDRYIPNLSMGTYLPLQIP